MRKLLFFLFIGVSYFVSAKSGTVYGVVKSDNGPLGFANVFLDGTSYGVFTDEKGKFEL